MAVPMRIAALVLTLLTAATGCRSRDDGDERAGEKLEPIAHTARGRAGQMKESGAECAAHPGLAICKRGCTLGHSNSCGELGDLLAASDIDEAIARWSEGCRGGSGIACAALARAAEAGTAQGARPPDELYARARGFLRVHCEQGHVRSCEELGDLFETTQGGPRDDAVAAHYHERACRLGRTQSCK